MKEHNYVKKKKFILQFPVDCSFVDKNLAIIEVQRFYPETPWSEKFQLLHT